MKQQLFLLLKFRVGSVIAAHTHCHRPADSPRWHEAAGDPDFLQLLLYLPGCSSPTASLVPSRPFSFFSSWARSVLRFVMKVPDSPANHLYYQSWKLGRNEKTMQILIHPYLSQHILAGSKLSFVFLILIPCFLPTHHQFLPTIVFYKHGENGVTPLYPLSMFLVCLHKRVMLLKADKMMLVTNSFSYEVRGG